MIRFAWLQARTQTLTTVAVLVALAIAAAITGVQLSHLYSSLVANCHTGCDLATNQFLSHDQFMDHALDILARAVPALIGIFWGAPLLARELEAETYKLAWTQSVSRSRWLVTKLVVVGVVTLTVAGVLTLTITWWYGAFHGLDSERYAVFDRRDIVPIGYAAFAFASGAFIGAVIRRTLPAMATSLAVFVFARVGTALWVRPHLMSPLHKALSLANASPQSAVQFGIASRNGSAVTLVAQGSGPPNSWTLSSHLATSTGHVPSSAQLATFMHTYCPAVGLSPSGPPPGAGISHDGAPPGVQACIAQAVKMFHVVVTYQPANRYWTFQWLETGIFLALALASAVGAYWWVARRSS